MRPADAARVPSVARSSPADGGAGATEHRRSLSFGLPSGAHRDYAATMLVNGVTLLSGLVLFHLVAQRAGATGFAYYQVARGVVTTLQPVAMIGLLLSVQRYLPVAGRQARTLGHRAFLVQLGIVAAVGTVGCLFAAELGQLLGIAGGTGPVRVIFLTLAGTCLWSLSVGALRGTGQVVRANVSWLLGLGVTPIGAFLLTERLQTFLAAQGAAMTVLAVWGVARAVPRLEPADREAGDLGPGDAVNRRRPTPTLRTLVGYGVRRTPGDIALPALFAFPTFFVAATADGPEAGYVGFATSTATLVCAGFAMLTPVLLPRLSRHFNRSSAGSPMWTRLRLLPAAAALVATVVTTVLAMAAEPVVRTFLGDEFMDAVPILRLGLLAAIPAAAFYAARPTLDALQDSPVTVKAVVGCFVLEVFVSYLADSYLTPAVSAVLAFGVACTVLGALTYAALLASGRPDHRQAL